MIFFTAPFVWERLILCLPERITAVPSKPSGPFPRKELCRSSGDRSHRKAEGIDSSLWTHQNQEFQVDRPVHLKNPSTQPAAKGLLFLFLFAPPGATFPL